MNRGAVLLPLQLIKSMKTSLVKQTADALKACQAAAKPAKSARKTATIQEEGEGMPVRACTLTVCCSRLGYRTILQCHSVSAVSTLQSD